MMFRDSRPPVATRGGRFGARRLSIAACVTMLVLGSGVAAAQEAPPVTVDEARGLYTVNASFSVQQPPAAAMAALTDYPAIPRFMPDVRTSVVLDRNGSHVLVQQEATARFMMFSKRVHLVLEIDETPDAIRFRDRCGKSFKRYEGQWAVSREGNETRVTYTLTAQPSFEVPEFLLKRLLRRDANRMIEGLKTEIAARGLAPAPASAR